MPVEPMNLTLEASHGLEVLDQAQQSLEQFLDQHQVDLESASEVALILEEVLVNILKHGRIEQSGETTVRIRAEIDDTTLQLQLNFEDPGIAFNPLDAPVPDCDLPPEQRPIGGLGVHLLKTLADQVDYQRDGHHNRLRVVKQVSRGS